MTRDSARKKKIRSIMSEIGVSYAVASRILDSTVDLSAQAPGKEFDPFRFTPASTEGEAAAQSTLAALDAPDGILDLDTLLQVRSDNTAPVTVVTGCAGEGKTALLLACLRHLCTASDPRTVRVVCRADEQHLFSEYGDPQIATIKPDGGWQDEIAALLRAAIADPGSVLLVDETPILASDDEVGALLNRLVRQARSLGTAAVLCGQVLRAPLSSSVLRDGLGRILMIGRTSATDAQRMLPRATPEDWAALRRTPRHVAAIEGDDGRPELARLPEPPAMSTRRP